MPERLQRGFSAAFLHGVISFALEKALMIVLQETSRLRRSVHGGIGIVATKVLRHSPSTPSVDRARHDHVSCSGQNTWTYDAFVVTCICRR